MKRLTLRIRDPKDHKRLAALAAGRVPPRSLNERAARARLLRAVHGEDRGREAEARAQHDGAGVVLRAVVQRRRPCRAALTTVPSVFVRRVVDEERRGEVDGVPRDRLLRGHGPALDRGEERASALPERFVRDESAGVSVVARLAALLLQVALVDHGAAFPAARPCW